MDVESHRQYRTLWISDLHLGSRGCQAELLLEFLDRYEAERIYLVGDILDFWKMKKSVYWPATHALVVQKLVDLARSGTQVVFIPGNHDAALRDYVGIRYKGLSIEERAIHKAADGKKYLILHGDEYDVVVRNYRWLSIVGDGAYTVLLSINHWFNRLRRLLGFQYWSLSAYIKLRVKNAVNYISRFEEILASEARRVGVDGVICGHIHHAEIREIDGVVYMNDGDWVESCTALAEDAEGKFRIIHYIEDKNLETADRHRRMETADQRSDSDVGADDRRTQPARREHVGAGS